MLIKKSIKYVMIIIASSILLVSYLFLLYPSLLNGELYTGSLEISGESITLSNNAIYSLLFVIALPMIFISYVIERYYKKIGDEDGWFVVNFD